MICYLILKLRFIYLVILILPMKIRNFILCLMFLVMGMLNVESECDKYLKLKNNESLSLKQSDLPDEFGDGAYNLIVDFIQKTRDLDYEWVLYFDYCTGEILRCMGGNENNVSLKFKDDEFKGYPVASIHNHPKNVLSPPSGKNFGILSRDFEDYELIAGLENFWILKAKGLHENLINSFKSVSHYLDRFSLSHCLKRYKSDEIIGKMHDLHYGNQLLKYINDKNITDIQLSKKEYITMDTNINTAEYSSSKRITDPETLKLLRDFLVNPFMPSGKDLAYALFQSEGMDVDYDEIFADE